MATVAGPIPFTFTNTSGLILPSGFSVNSIDNTSALGVFLTEGNITSIPVTIQSVTLPDLTLGYEALFTAGTLTLGFQIEGRPTDTQGTANLAAVRNAVQKFEIALLSQYQHDGAPTPPTGE